MYLNATVYMTDSVLAEIKALNAKFQGKFMVPWVLKSYEDSIRQIFRAGAAQGNCSTDIDDFNGEECVYMPANEYFDLY